MVPSIALLVLPFVLAAEAKAYSKYLEFKHDLPEDHLIEFRRLSANGQTFVLGQGTAEAQRTAWRRGAHLAQSKDMSLSDIDEIMGPSSDKPFAERVPLRPFLKYLARYWEAADEDYPDPKKLAAMKMEELIEGDNWKFIDAP